MQINGGGLPIDFEADRSRTGEGDDIDVGTLHERRADLLADPRQEVDDAVGHAGLQQDVHEFGGDDRRLLGRLDHDRVPHRQRGDGHAGQDRQWEIPRSDDNHHAARPVVELVLLARQIDSLRLRHRQHLLGVKAAEVDRLGDVAVGIFPRLADFVNDPRRKLHPLIAQMLGDQIEVLGPVLRLDTRPAEKRSLRGGDRILGIVLRRRRDLADRRHPMRWAGRNDGSLGLDDAAVDDQRVLVTELSFDVVEPPIETPCGWRPEQSQSGVHCERTWEKFRVPSSEFRVLHFHW